MRELQPGVGDSALVALHRGFVLPHQRLLGVDLLTGDGILRKKSAVAVKVYARVLKQRLVARQLPGSQGELDLERPRVDLGKEIASVDHLALFKCDAHDLTVDAAANQHGIEWRYRSKRKQVDIEYTLPHRGDSDGNRTSRSISAFAPVGSAARARTLRRIRPGAQVPGQRTDYCESHDGDDRQAALAAPRPDWVGPKKSRFGVRS